MRAIGYAKGCEASMILSERNTHSTPPSIGPKPTPILARFLLPNKRLYLRWTRETGQVAKRWFCS